MRFENDVRTHPVIVGNQRSSFVLLIDTMASFDRPHENVLYRQAGASSPRRAYAMVEERSPRGKRCTLKRNCLLQHGFAGKATRLEARLPVADGAGVHLTVSLAIEHDLR